MTVSTIILEKLRKENIGLREENDYLKEQLEWLRRQIFGQCSERVVKDLNSQQMTFEGFDNLPTSTEEQTKTIPAHEHRKLNRNGQDKITLPSDLPVQTTILDIPEEKKLCKETNSPAVRPNRSRDTL